MNKPHRNIGKNLFVQLFEKRSHGSHRYIRAFLHRGADNICPVPGGGFPADKAVHSLKLSPVNAEGVNLLPSGGKGVDERNIHIAVHNKRKCSRNRRCRHNKRVRRGAFFRQKRALPYPETMLFIGYCERKTVKMHLFGNKCMCSENNAYFARLQLFVYFVLFFLFCAPCQKRRFKAKPGKNRGQTVKVLQCQNLRRRHHCRLAAVFRGKIHCCCGYHGFTAADIALHKSVHAKATRHIVHNIAKHALLSIGKGKRQLLEKRFNAAIGEPRPDRFCSVFLNAAQRCLKQKKFLKHKPPPRYFKTFFILGEVNAAQSVHAAAKVIPLRYFGRQRFIEVIRTK